MNAVAPFSALEAAADELEAELAALVEREDGPGQRAAKERLLTLLAASIAGTPLTREQALQIIADAGRQTDVRGNKITSRANGRANGRAVKPEPDLAYNARFGKATRRVNVEVDSDPKAAVRHIRELRHADPSGVHVGLIVHPVTGAPIDGVVWDPRRKQARRMSAAEVNALQKGELPRAVIPAPKARQRNPAVPKRAPRNPKAIANTLNSAVKGLNRPSRTTPSKPRQPTRPRRKGSREGELELAAFELGALLTS